MAYESSKNIIKAPKIISAEQMNDGNGTYDIEKKKLIAICDKWDKILNSYIQDFGQDSFNQIFKKIGNVEANDSFSAYVSLRKNLTNLKNKLNRDI